ncbi:MAG: hypothetical protein C0600_16270 [Ignavibacteria bacterium]|nr:MAG: hypothetical protein C0600_16270 [Ignavibacteria bacterium]
MKNVASVIFIIVAVTALLGIAACDHGLSPLNARSDPGIAGILRIRSAWPPADSVRDLRVVAFRNYPPNDILTEVITGSAVFSDEIPYGEEEIPYIITAEALAGVFEYVAVAQNYGDDMFQDWRAIGVYTVTGDVQTPTPVDLAEGLFLGDIDIDVDFYNLPPQPF